MSVVADTVIQKVTANNIVGAITDFNSRVPNAIYGLATYHSGNLPHFSGSCQWGNNTTAGTTYLSNPEAIESNQFNSKTIPTLSVSDTVITAPTLWNAMLNITVAMNKVRYFTAYWYHTTNSTTSQITSMSGRAVFNTSFPPVTGGSNAVNGQSRYWTRSGSTGVTFSASSTLVTNNMITAANMNTTIQNCYNAWYNNCYTANSLTYNMYTCHLNCHSSCHDSRSRR